MKFVLTGDWHVTDKRPRARRDPDYLQTCTGKLEQIVQLANAYDACILQPGDLVDSARANLRTVAAIIDTLAHVTNDVYGVCGQHDLWYHNPDVSNTPMAVLESSGCVQLLRGPQPASRTSKYERAHIYGASWGEEIPEIIDPAAYNILVTHRMVIEDEHKLLFPGQTDFTTPTHLLDTTAFDCIVCGDNHTAFLEHVWEADTKKTRCVVNCGSLMRSTVAQGEHRPHVYLLDTQAKNENLQVFYLDVLPADGGEESILDLSLAEAERAANERLQAFINGLSEDRNATTDFRANLARAMKDKSIRPAVKRMVTEMVHEEA